MQLCRALVVRNCFRCNLLLEMPGWGHFPTGPLDAKSANIFILDSCILMQNDRVCCQPPNDS